MNQMWGPALDAELEYRRERAARAYGTPSAWARLRAWVAARRAARSQALATRAHDAVERFADTFDTVASPTGWETRVARRTAEIEEGLEGLRPQALGRRAA
jgi:hypothetical protein